MLFLPVPLTLFTLTQLPVSKKEHGQLGAIFTFYAMFFPFEIFLQFQAIPCPPGLLCSTPGTGGVGAINSLISTLIGWLLSIAFGVTVLFLIIGGFMYIISGGNEERAEKAKGAVVNAIIGIVIIILSYVILNTIVRTLTGSPSVAP